MVLDHIGIVVRSIEDGIQQWVKLFNYRQATEIVHNTRQKVRVVFLAKNNSITIKLTEPSGEDSPIYRFARKGGGLHHLCFRCEHMDQEIARIKDEGARCTVPPEPGEAFDNHNIAFMLAKNNLPFELIDTEIKKGWESPR